MGRWGVWGIIATCALCGSAEATEPANLHLRATPPPTWDVPLQIPSDAASSTTAVDVLVSDLQLRADPVPSALYRQVERARTSAGLARVADVRVTFDPTYERVVFHGLDVVRAGVRQPRLESTPATLIQAETDLSAQIFDGRRTYVFFLEDLRVGDLVDLRYTIIGRNPALGTKIAVEARFASWDPIVLNRFRLLSPAQRPLTEKVRGAMIAAHAEERDGWRDARWTAGDLAPFRHEDRVPSWFSDHPAVSLSEWASWSEVRAWIRSLYARPLEAPPSAELGDLIDRIAAEARTPEARLLSALRFVQREVRYFGIELGERSHVPSAPSEVLARRFGDCKDKSVLLVALLRRLGVDADLALVHTRKRRSLDDALPSMGQFNHVIVRSRIAGVERWHDATDDAEVGRLEVRAPPPFERALVIDTSTGGLARIPARTEPSTLWIDELYRLDERGGAQLWVHTTASGVHATALRGALEADREGWIRDALQYYAGRDPTLTAHGPLSVSDDPEANRIEVTETYAIATFWRDQRRDLEATAMGAVLDRPEVALRERPLSVPHPEVRRHRVTVVRSAAWGFRDERTQVTSPAFELTDESTSREGTFTSTLEYQSRADHVPTEETSRHLAALTRARARESWWLREPAAAAPPAEQRSGAWVYLAGGLALAGLGLARVVGRRRRRSAATEPAGATPATALHTRPDAAALARWRCHACRRVAAAQVTGEDTARLGERRLRVLGLTCSACGRRTSIYVAG